MELPVPQAEHHWLQRLIGDWDFEHECVMSPDQPPMKSSGTLTVRPLGQTWIVSEMLFQMPDGGNARSIIQLGFDPAKGKFFGSFISNCMTHYWPYVGTLEGNVLTLNSEGPNFSDPSGAKTAPYQDIIEIHDDNNHTMTSRLQGEDGQWTQFMVGQYRRVTAAASESKPASGNSNDMQGSLTPHLVCADALKAIEFYQAAFGAELEVKLVGAAGMLVHGAMRIGKAHFMLAEEGPNWGSFSPKYLKGSPVTLHLVVPDVDASIARAVAAGATLMMPAADMFWGDRYGQVVDPFGHRWSIATPKKSLSPAELQAAMLTAFGVPTPAAT